MDLWDFIGFIDGLIKLTRNYKLQKYFKAIVTMHALKSHVKITFLQVKKNNSYLVLQGFFGLQGFLGSQGFLGLQE